jgi:hypothetical protein
VVQELELLVLFRGDVHGGRNLVPCHGRTMHDHMSIVNAGSTTARTTQQENRTPVRFESLQAKERLALAAIVHLA